MVFSVSGIIFNGKTVVHRDHSGYQGASLDTHQVVAPHKLERYCDPNRLIMHSGECFRFRALKVLRLTSRFDSILAKCWNSQLMSFRFFFRDKAPSCWNAALFYMM